MFKTLKLKGEITAKMVGHSISPDGDHIYTMELEYPRFIHSELMTHRVFSRNAASSRAIPLKSMIDHVLTNTAFPVFWGKKQAGMAADFANDQKVGHKQYDHLGKMIHKSWISPDTLWHRCAALMCKVVEEYDEAGYHKQIPNRIIEPFQMMKTIVTTTDLSNFLNLRVHSKAQPEIRELAIAMYLVSKNSIPFEIKAGEYHTPYLRRERDAAGVLHYYVPQDDGTEVEVDTEMAKKVSTCAVAQVSYRKLDTTPYKVNAVFDLLLLDDVIHASAFEHVATPIVVKESLSKLLVKNWPSGVTHMDKLGNLYSGNFRGYIQYRQEIPNNAVNEYTEALDSTLVQRIEDMGYDITHLEGGFYES